MLELFTFNSNQLQSIVKRPASTDNAPSIRKRLIISRFSKKQTPMSEASTREQVITPLSENRNSPIRNVTFDINNASFCGVANPLKYRLSVKKAKSFNQNEIKHCIIESLDRLNQNRQPLQQIQNTQNAHELGKRSMSYLYSKDKQSEKKKQDQIVGKQAGIFRAKRMFSLKCNPKIVPISQRKLPKAFKIHASSNKSYIKSEKNKAQLQDIVNKQMQTCKSSKQRLNKLEGISKLQHLFLLEAKLFEKLYCPKWS